jgi:hypothetical protein
MDYIPTTTRIGIVRNDEIGDMSVSETILD